jgi:hypothetical protein
VEIIIAIVDIKNISLLAFLIARNAYMIENEPVCV